MLTKSLSCNIAAFTGMPYFPESSKYSEFISLRWKRPYYDKFQCHKLQEGYFSVQWRFCANFNSEKSDSLFPSERSLVSNIHPNDVAIPSELPSMSIRFEQFKVAFVRTSWQHIRMLFRVREESSIPVHPSGRRGNTVWTPIRVQLELVFPLQTYIWEDSCIRPDDMVTLSRRYPW